MQAWCTLEGYDVGCLNQRRKLEGMCHYKYRKPTGEGLHSRAVWHKGSSIGCIARKIGRDRAGESEIAAVRTVFSYLAERKRQKTVDTLLRLSRLPSREPKTFEGFGFSRIQGRDADMLHRLPVHRNIAFIGPRASARHTSRRHMGANAA